MEVVIKITDLARTTISRQTRLSETAWARLTVGGCSYTEDALDLGAGIQEHHGAGRSIRHCNFYHLFGRFFHVVLEPKHHVVEDAADMV